MQNAKDTFYLMLQGRLATINPARTVVLRGLIRPGILVVENELPSASPPTDAFRLEWTGLHTTTASPLPLVALECAIHYATDGSPGNAGMARGRLLAAMDAELAAALAQHPHAVPKLNYTTTPPTTMATNIFWANPVFAASLTTGERLSRIATVQVFAYQEAGEL
jgi:hypothetical protein